MTDSFTIKDSGQREEFSTGSRRDTEESKLDHTLHQFEALDRDAAHMMKGAGKYGRHNWAKGQSMARADRSMVRHLIAYLKGERDEDHLAALRFNAGLVMDHEARIARGELPRELDDRDEHRRTAPPNLELRVGAQVRIVRGAPFIEMGTSRVIGTTTKILSVNGNLEFGEVYYLALPNPWDVVYWSAECLEVIG
jgi:hypothetical protein